MDNFRRKETDVGNWKLFKFRGSLQEIMDDFLFIHIFIGLSKRKKPAKKFIISSIKKWPPP
jgi:hypothetical protein